MFFFCHSEGEARRIFKILRFALPLGRYSAHKPRATGTRAPAQDDMVILRPRLIKRPYGKIPYDPIQQQHHDGYSHRHGTKPLPSVKQPETNGRDPERNETEDHRIPVKSIRHIQTGKTLHCSGDPAARAVDMTAGQQLNRAWNTKPGPKREA